MTPTKQDDALAACRRIYEIVSGDEFEDCIFGAIRAHLHTIKQALAPATADLHDALRALEEAKYFVHQVLEDQHQDVASADQTNAYDYAVKASLALDEVEKAWNTRKDKADAEIERLTKERDEWKNKYLMKISEPVGK